MTLEQHDRLPGVRLEPTVDAVRLGDHLADEVIVSLDACTARRANLHERKLTLVVRPALQKSLNAAEPLENAFGVVDPIDANPQEARGDADVLHQPHANVAGRL